QPRAVPPDRWPTPTGHAGEKVTRCHRGGHAGSTPTLPRPSLFTAWGVDDARPGEGSVVTEHRQLKRRLRERAAGAGESYTPARRHVLAAAAGGGAPTHVAGYPEFG